MPTTARKDAFVESTKVNMDLERKLWEICAAIKQRHPNKSVSVDVVLWHYRSEKKETQYKVWIQGGDTELFNSLEELIAYEKNLPVRNPILFRKFK